MTNNLQILEITTTLIEKHFGADLVAFNNNATIQSVERLKQLLTAMVGQLLDKDLESLLRAMYRIDIDEQKFNEILTFSPSDKIAETLAEEIFLREEKKAFYRLKYS